LRGVGELEDEARRWPSPSVASSRLAAATMSAVGAPGVAVVCAALRNPNPASSTTRTTTPMFFFTSESPQPA
jgi:hypothetical protein